jgi:aspartyl-tRNA(Asn)/glutamyl-tRNA(Gln) amidotransferase subunit A
MTAPLQASTVTDLAPRLASRTLTSAALTEACLGQIERRQPELNAFITVTADVAREQAAAVDAEIAAGRYRGPLHGVPVSLKDLIDLRRTPTTAASRVRDGHLARDDAAVVARLRSAGAVFVGKCNLHEFAFGTTNEDSAFGPARNPHDPTRSPGGSSGGSAAAVIAGMCIASVGTDTGGSIRIPSAACGTVGLKPTFGELPLDGIVPLSRTLDHVGPITQCVNDAWFLYRVMAGEMNPPSLADEAVVRSERLRVGVPSADYIEPLEAGVRARFDWALQRLVESGVRVDEVRIPHASDTAAIYLHIVLPEAAAFHAATLDSRPLDYTEPVRTRLQMARYVLAEDYVRALQGRLVLRAEVDDALLDRDALLMPSLAIPAPRLGATSVDVGAGKDSVRNVTLRLTQPFNLTGHPAISLPIGTTPGGLPVGLQLVGHHGRTEALLRTALSCERRLAWT